CQRNYTLCQGRYYHLCIGVAQGGSEEFDRNCSPRRSSDIPLQTLGFHGSSLQAGRLLRQSRCSDRQSALPQYPLPSPKEPAERSPPQHYLFAEPRRWYLLPRRDPKETVS